MTIKEIYNLAIKMGIAADPRGKVGIQRWLTREKKKYQKLTTDEKGLFDSERLINPYADSRIHFGEPGKKIKTIVAGIEIEEAVLSGEIIEEYPDDKYSPSCLIYGHTKTGRHLHVQISLPPSVVIITVYEPDETEWIDYRIRRTKE